MTGQGRATLGGVGNCCLSMCIQLSFRAASSKLDTSGRRIPANAPNPDPTPCASLRFCFPSHGAHDIKTHRFRLRQLSHWWVRQEPQLLLLITVVIIATLVRIIRTIVITIKNIFYIIHNNRNKHKNNNNNQHKNNHHNKNTRSWQCPSCRGPIPFEPWLASASCTSMPAASTPWRCRRPVQGHDCCSCLAPWFSRDPYIYPLRDSIGYLIPSFPTKNQPA